MNRNFQASCLVEQCVCQCVYLVHVFLRVRVWVWRCQRRSGVTAQTERRAGGRLASAATRLSRHTTRRGAAYRSTHTVYTQWALSPLHHAPAAAAMWNIHTGTKGRGTGGGGRETCEVWTKERVQESGVEVAQWNRNLWQTWAFRWMSHCAADWELYSCIRQEKKLWNSCSKSLH